MDRIQRQMVFPGDATVGGKGMNKDEMLLVDGLQLCNWDRALLLEMKKGGLDCIHACIGLWENTREALSKIGQWYQFFNLTIVISFYR